ncbi:S15A5 protein, partial [Polyodon spathula]|nr:S15A5 protein [Polyodon spathula]
MAVIDLTDLQEKSFPKQGTTQPRRARRRAPPRRRLQGVVCVLLVELCERFTFFGIVCNMILFCTLKLGYNNVQAAAVNLVFIGACTLTPVLVGWVAESRLGRTKVLYICALLHFIVKSLLHCGTFCLPDPTSCCFPKSSTWNSLWLQSQNRALPRQQPRGLGDCHRLVTESGYESTNLEPSLLEVQARCETMLQRMEQLAAQHRESLPPVKIMPPPLPVAVSLNCDHKPRLRHDRL